MRSIAVAVALACAPSVASAQVSVGVSVDFSYDSVAPGDAVGSVDVFYDQLSPYGVWVDDPDLGQVFTPDREDYVPYTAGHWENTNVGFVWVSAEPFAWATSHYGRWAYSRPFGRWVWRPDTTWGPSWVEWREAGNELGWAPLGPDGYEVPIEAWRYAPADRVLAVDVSRYYAPRERVITVHRSARRVDHYVNVSNARVVVGPRPDVLRTHRVQARRVTASPRIVGRFSAQEARESRERATRRRDELRTQNHRKLEGNVRLRERQHQAAQRRNSQPAEQRRDVPRPQPEPRRVDRREPAPQPRAERKDAKPESEQRQPRAERRPDAKPQPEARAERKPDGTPQPDRKAGEKPTKRERDH
jgi:hypothetical protein